MVRNIARFLLVLAILIGSVPSIFGQQILLGVLEDNPGHYAGEANFRTVRVVFEKKGDDWQPFRSDCRDQACLKTTTSTYPSEVTWTVTFDGKSVGQVTSRTPTDFAWYASVGQEEITTKGPVPTVGVRSSEFGGFSDAAVYRPLIANSQPHFKDPERWKPTVISAELVAILQKSFRNKFPKLCRLSGPDESKLEPFPYRDADVKVAKAYASLLGWTVVRLHLQAVDCEDTEAGFDIDDPWFVVDTKQSATYLDSGMWLVDAGDYDNDGRSELVFSINRYNRGGYEIFYDAFKKRAVFEFTYH
jgi:hypothetical protein